MKERRDLVENGIAEEKEETRALFAAANSGGGFVSFYDSVFGKDTFKKRYIVKGGPGTGKSSFMKAIAADAEARGMAVSYYRCSSDPDSLDGIVIEGTLGGIAVLDGTAPHAMDTELPGARDEIVNLGEFWDAEKLGERYDEIVALSGRKSDCYRKAYRFLSAASEVAEVNFALVRPFVREEKMRGAVTRLLRAIPNGEEFRVTVGLADSIGMKGSVRMDTYERQAKKLYLVDDYYETGWLFLAAMLEEATRKGCAVRISYHPLIPTRPDALLFSESGVGFVLGEHSHREADGRINMKRFVSADALGAIKAEYRINRRLYEALLDSAKEALAETGRHHFELERIYGACMDFESQRKFIRSFCQKIR